MSEERELRGALEAAQQELKRLRARIDELISFDPEELLGRIATLELENRTMRERLERADEVRATWDLRARALKRELDIARQEQDRLRSLLENERLSRGR
ncbi:MAG: hypothetical protein ACOZQL_29575 [Myxococcota bacterium]